MRNKDARTSLSEKRLEGVILDGGALGLLPVRLDSVLKAKELPACVADLQRG